MSNHRQTTAPGPSLVSIIVMALATLGTIGTGLWIVSGATDERHLTGAGVAFVLAVVLTAQTMGRAYDRVAAVERAAIRKRRIIGDAGRVVSLGTSPSVDDWPDPVATQPIPVDDSPTQVIWARY